MSTLLSTAAHVLVDATLKATLALLLAAGVTLLMRRASAATRHVVWVLAASAALLVPVLSALLPAWNVLPTALAWPVDEPALIAAPSSTGSVGSPEQVMAFQPEPAQTPARPLSAAKTSNTAVASAGVAPVPAPARAGAAAPAPISRERISRAVAVTWLIGVALALLPVLVGQFSLRRLARRAALVTDGEWTGLLAGLCAELGLNRPVSLLRDDRRRVMPMTWGVIHARLLLPAEAPQWSAQRRRVVLLHELAHVKRHDCLTQWVMQLACAAFWFHPLAWYARKRLLAERERACDDMVLALGRAPAPDYADHILQLAASLRVPRFTSRAAIAMARASQLETRLLAILDDGRKRGAAGGRVTGIALASAVLLIVPLAALRPHAAAGPLAASQPDASILRDVPVIATAVGGSPADTVFIDITDDTWHSCSWAGANNTEVIALDRCPKSHPIFIVAQPLRTHVWVKPLQLPVDSTLYPILIVKYRSTNTALDPARYAMWLDDGTGPNTAGLYYFSSADVTPDGRVRTFRIDLREQDARRRRPTGPICTIAVGVTCGEMAPASFELMEVRFERATDVAAAPPPVVKDADQSIAVRVLDAEGNAIPGARVIADAERTNFARESVADERGVARVLPLENESKRHVVRALASGFGAADQVLESLPPTPQKAPIDIVLTRSDWIYGGTIRDVDGKPVAGASIQIAALDEAQARVRPIHPQRSHQLLSDADGRWQSPPLPENARIGLRVNHPRYVKQPEMELAPDVQALATRTAVTVLQRGVIVSGRVLSEAGEPIVGATVRQGPHAWGSDYPSTKTDLLGRFVLPHNAPADSLTITAQVAGHSPELKYVDGTSDVDGVEFRLRRGNSIRGRVVDESGTPVNRALVSLEEWRGASAISWSRATDINGEFQWIDAPADEVVVNVSKPGYLTRSAVRMVARDDPYTVTLQKDTSGKENR